MKVCIACGMPMEKTEDFALGDKKKDYCIYCARKDGTMKSYEEAFTDSVCWAMNEYKISEEEAKVRIREHFKTMPAWKGN